MTKKYWVRVSFLERRHETFAQHAENEWEAAAKVYQNWKSEPDFRIEYVTYEGD